MTTTMTTTLPSGPPSIFKDGKLKNGIFKIQNLLTGGYVDVEAHSMGVCCRPAKNLEEGRGLVRWHPSSAVHISDG